MGRLMDSVMAALGLKPSDRVKIDIDTIVTENKPRVDQEKEPQIEITQLREKTTAVIDNRKEPTAFGGLPVFATGPRKKEQKDSEQETKEAIKEFKELVKSAKIEEKTTGDPKDCLGCKVTSSVVGTGLIAYFLYYAKYNPMALKGWRLASFRSGTTMTALVIAATTLTAIFGEGLTEEEKKAQEERSSLEQFQFEMNYIGQKLGIKTSESKKPVNSSKEKLRVDKS